MLAAQGPADGEIEAGRGTLLEPHNSKETKGSNIINKHAEVGCALSDLGIASVWPQTLSVRLAVRMLMHMRVFMLFDVHLSNSVSCLQDIGKLHTSGKQIPQGMSPEVHQVGTAAQWLVHMQPVLALCQCGVEVSADNTAVTMSCIDQSEATDKSMGMFCYMRHTCGHQ